MAYLISPIIRLITNRPVGITLRPVGILKTRSNKPTRSVTKPFVGLYCENREKISANSVEKLSNLAILTNFGKDEALGVSSQAF